MQAGSFQTQGKLNLEAVFERRFWLGTRVTYLSCGKGEPGVKAVKLEASSSQLVTVTSLGRAGSPQKWYLNWSPIDLTSNHQYLYPLNH